MTRRSEPGERRRLLTLWRRKDGATAVEFALIAVPFFWLMFAIAEIAGISMIQTSLDAAVSETARKIRTGQAQAGNLSAAQVKTDVCQYLQRLMTVDCASNLNLDVRRFDDFDSVNGPSPLVAGAIDPTRLGFQPGASSEIVLVRGFYSWKIMTPLFGTFFANVGSDKHLVVSSVLFRNEPF